MFVNVRHLRAERTGTLAFSRVLWYVRDALDSVVLNTLRHFPENDPSLEKGGVLGRMILWNKTICCVLALRCV